MNKLSNVDIQTRKAHWNDLAVRSNYNVQRMAYLTGISVRQLQRYFQKDFGCAPREWLHEKRMMAAFLRLGNANSVKEVAFDLGFKQVSHFCRAFKDFYGVRPSEKQRNELFSAPVATR